MRFWLDTEFNEFRGELISMALVAEDGREWYEVLPCPNPRSWVAQHVMPILGKNPLNNQLEMSWSLCAFLSQFGHIHIIADWPEDIAYFCGVLITGPGQRIETPPTTFEIDRDLDAAISAVPHNALEDARAMFRLRTR
jgi:hypothetical protein